MGQTGQTEGWHEYDQEDGPALTSSFEKQWRKWDVRKFALGIALSSALTPGVVDAEQLITRARRLEDYIFRGL